MNTSRFKLKSFLHQRLFVAGDEIFGEMERTITSARHVAAGVGRSTEGVEGVGHRRMSAARLQTSSTTEPGEKCDRPLTEQNPGPSLTSAGLGCNSWNINAVDTDLKISPIQEELGDESQTQEIVFPSPEIMKTEQVLPGIQVSQETQPGSWTCSAAQSENNDHDEEGVNREGGPTKRVKRDGQISHDNNGQALLPFKKLCTKNLKERNFCHFCGKSFKYNSPLINHLTDCDVCGTKFKCTKQLVTHLKHFHKNTCFTCHSKERPYHGGCGASVTMTEAASNHT